MTRTHSSPRRPISIVPSGSRRLLTRRVLLHWPPDNAELRILPRFPSAPIVPRRIADIRFGK
jgi:hypothetical protein